VTDSLATFRLQASADRRTLTANWRGPYGSPHAGVVGSYTGTLNQSGTAYTGAMHVTEGPVSAGGTMTFTIGAPAKYGSPLLTVSYQQDNGVSGHFRLEIWFLPPRIAPGGGPGASFEFHCPGQDSCDGEAQGVPAGGAIRVDNGGTGRAARRPAKPVIVGSVRFSIKPGHARRISLLLNKNGRKLLAKRGSLRVRIKIILKNRSKLPRTITVGTVTFHK
jgi:hypothetical protein